MLSLIYVKNVVVEASCVNHELCEERNFKIKNNPSDSG